MTFFLELPIGSKKKRSSMFSLHRSSFWEQVGFSFFPPSLLSGGVGFRMRNVTCVSEEASEGDNPRTMANEEIDGNVFIPRGIRFDDSRLPGSQEVGVRTIKTASTFGPRRGTSKPSTSNYLKKHTRKDECIGKRGSAINHGRKRQSIKPPVPLQSELPLEKERIPEDFLKKNVSLVREVTRRPTPTPSPEPLKKHGYGQVPKYLTSMKRQMEAKKSAQEEEMKAQESRSETGVRLLPEEDRLSILKKLQEEWQMRNQEFQRFSFVVDTEMKRKRREDLLRKLQVLEKDIQTMSKPNIYVLAEEAGTMSHEAYVMY